MNRRILVCAVAAALALTAGALSAQKTDPPADRVAALNQAVVQGRRLHREPHTGYLRSVLEALAVPVESQLLVFSKTGAQRAITGPQHPRALYFNESVAVGYVPEAPAIEIAAYDPGRGVAFYTLDQTAERPSFARQTSCLTCHVSTSTLGVPGLIARSHIVGDDGNLLAQPAHDVDHRTPHTERWGGWYVTSLEVAQYNHLAHLGNITFSGRTTSNQVFIDWLASAPETRGYLSASSDIAALLVFDHEARALNLMTKLALSGGTPAAVDELTDYLLFKDEAPISPPVTPRAGFAASLEARVPKDRRGRSCGQLDLARRLLRHPCSFMIYSDAFEGLPRDVRSAVYRRMLATLPADSAIVEILRDTTPDFPR